MDQQNKQRNETNQIFQTLKQDYHTPKSKQFCSERNYLQGINANTSSLIVNGYTVCHKNI